MKSLITKKSNRKLVITKHNSGPKELSGCRKTSALIDLDELVNDFFFFFVIGVRWKVEG